MYLCYYNAHSFTSKSFNNLHESVHNAQLYTTVYKCINLIPEFSGPILDLVDSFLT